MAAFDTTRTNYGSLNMASHLGFTLTSMTGALSSLNDARATSTHDGSPSIASRIGSTFTTMTGALSAWNDARVTRNTLSRLSNRELEDIGLVRGDIDMVAHGHNYR